MKLKTIVEAMDTAHLRIITDIIMDRPGYKNARQYHAFKNRIVTISKDVRKDEANP